MSYRNPAATSHPSAGNDDRTATGHQLGPKRGWRLSLVDLAKTLVEYRLTLRSASRRAGDPQLAHRLRRLARRSRQVTKQLRLVEPGLDGGDVVAELDPITGEPVWLGDAGEIGALGACLRRNRKVRSAIAKVIDGGPPTRLLPMMERLSERLRHEAGSLNAWIRDLAVLPKS